MGSDFNLAEYVLREGRQYPDKLAMAVIAPDKVDRWSYARLISAIMGTAAGLKAAGLQEGDRALLRIGNEPAFPIAYLGCIAAGIVAVPTSAALTVTEITKMAAGIGPKLIIAGEGVALPVSDAPVLSVEQMQMFYSLPPAEFAMGDPERLAYIIFTSGSSGTPRAVCHAHRAILARRMMFEGWYGLQQSDRVLHAGAFNWTFTLGTGLMDPWTLGATALIPRDGTAIEQLPLLAARHGASIIAAAPGVFRRMMRSDFRVWAELRHGLTAGERLDSALRRDWEAHTKTALHEAMGMSECSTFISGSPARPAPEGAAGYPQEGRVIAILSDEGEVLPKGQAGQLAISRNDQGLFIGYDNEPAETQARFSGDWFLTGDIAMQGEGGAITILGRTDDMMNAGGFRVSPAEVEDVLNKVPDAGEVAVTELAVPSGAKIIAVFWTGGADQAQMAEAANLHLADYKRPREYRRIEVMPKTATGKIDRRSLRRDHPIT